MPSKHHRTATRTIATHARGNDVIARVTSAIDSRDWISIYIEPTDKQMKMKAADGSLSVTKRCAKPFAPAESICCIAPKINVMRTSHTR